MKKTLLFLSLFMVAGAPEAFSKPYRFSVIDVPGAARTSAGGVNNLGHIVGSYSDGLGEHGFLYDGNGFRTIDYPGGPGDTRLRDINDAGTIVGRFSEAAAGGMDLTTSFVYDGQGYASFALHGSFIGQTETTLNGINDAGAVAGGYYDWADNSSNGFIYRDGKSSVLTSSAIFSDVNDTGMMTGYEPDSYISFVYDGATLRQIILDPKNQHGTDIWAWGINDTGVVVGEFYDSEMNASAGFVYDGRAAFSLLYPGSIQTTLSGINDLGHIVGSFTDRNSVAHGFIATPVNRAQVPEPPALVLSALAIGAVAACGFFMGRRESAVQEMA